MKKLLSLILCLMLCLPAMAMAEAEAAATETSVQLYPIDFGTFTMSIGENDQYQVAAELASNTVYAIIYVNYDPTAVIADTLNVVWTTDDVPGEIEYAGSITKYGELGLQEASTLYTSMGIKMSNESVIAAEFDGTSGYILTSCTMDYTGAGYDLVTPLYQMQMIYCGVQGGTYIFTLTADTYSDLVAMTDYLDTLSFK